MKTKLFTLLLAIMATNSLWAKFQYGNLYYEKISSNTAEVVGYLGEPTSVTIPSVVQYNGAQYTVTSIGNSAFDECSSLTSVTIPNSVTSFGIYAFGRCISLTSVTIPNSMTKIGDYAFGGCESLTSITIPNSVTKIGNYAFYNCSFLISATIGNSVTSIGKYVFGNCSLNKVVCEAVLVPSTESNAFENVVTSSAILYVPDEAVNIYKYMDPWDKFGTILPISQLPTDVENVQTIGGMDPPKKKLIRDGQVVILHNDKSYNIMGQEIK